VAWVHATDVTPPEIRLLQFAELARVAAKYGFDPTPNEFPTDEPEPEPAEVALRRHLAHLTLAGSVLDPAYKPQPPDWLQRLNSPTPFLIGVHGKGRRFGTSPGWERRRM
jgi:hypothetical protein